MNFLLSFTDMLLQTGITFSSVDDTILVTETVWLLTFFKISSFMFCKRMQIIQVWNDMQNNHILVAAQGSIMSSLENMKNQNISELINELSNNICFR